MEIKVRNCFHNYILIEVVIIEREEGNTVKNKQNVYFKRMEKIYEKM